MDYRRQVHSFARAKTPLRMLFAALFVLLLYGCSSRHGPAPVENVYVKSADKPGIQYKSFGSKRSYKVQKGDTMYSIAWRAGVDFRQLAQINNIKAPYEIFPGQIIQLKVKPRQPSKTKASKPVVKNKTTQTPKNVAKTLATPKQGEYGQRTKDKKPLDKSKDKAKTIARKKVEKPTSQRPVKSTNQSYSNKVRKWVWPTAGKLIGRFSNKENGIKGIDIAGSKGTSIVSAADGKVVYYGNALRGYGNLIIIKHNDDYLSAYAHNRKVLVKEKEFVKAGQKIAEMGDSDSERVKLHFQVRYRGKSVNPLKYLPKR